MTETASTPTELDIGAILEHIPHRYPFAMVDRVTECVAGERITGFKNVTINEPQFTGHFPGNPIMPGVLILEALAQLSGILTLQTLGKLLEENEYYYFASIERARFKRPVVPGDQLELNASILAQKRNIWRFDCVAKVDGQVACQAVLTSARVAQ